MVSSPAEVCNLALLKVGSRQLLTSLEENTAESQACKALYAHNRDLVLAAAEWSFSTRHAELAEVTDGAVSGWGYVYALPTDCGTPLYIWTGARNPPPEDRLPFKLEWLEVLDATGRRTFDGKVLLTDQPDAELVYARKMDRDQHTSLFTPGFVEALAAKLAMELVRAVPVKLQGARDLAQEYRIALSSAVAQDRQASTPDVDPEGSLVRARE